jgi:hypothetical protein
MSIASPSNQAFGRTGGPKNKKKTNLAHGVVPWMFFDLLTMA